MPTAIATTTLDPALGWLLGLGSGLLFAASAHHKLRDLPRFTATLRAYALLPNALVPPVALGLVGLEVGLALSLPLAPVLPGLARVTGLAAAGLLVVYAVAIAVNLLRGRRGIDCGCLGAAARSTPLSGGLVLRNLALACLLATTAMPRDTRSLELVDALTIGGGLVALTLVYLAIDQLVALPARRVDRLPSALARPEVARP